MSPRNIHVLYSNNSLIFAVVKRIAFILSVYIFVLNILPMVPAGATDIRQESQCCSSSFCAPPVDNDQDETNESGEQLPCNDDCHPFLSCCLTKGFTIINEVSFYEPVAPIEEKFVSPPPFYSFQHQYSIWNPPKSN